MHTPPSSSSSCLTSVLLIEPDQAIAQRFQKLLTAASSSTPTIGIASSLQEGLSYLQTHHVMAVLINLALPDSTGPDAVRVLRQAADSSALIGFNSLPDTTLLFDAIRAGVHDVLPTIPSSAEALGLSIQCALIRAANTRMGIESPQSAVSTVIPAMRLSKVTHDLNNSLTSINGFTDILLARLPSGDPSYYCAEQIKQACTKTHALVKLLSSSPITSSPPQSSDPSDIASAA